MPPVLVPIVRISEVLRAGRLMERTERQDVRHRLPVIKTEIMNKPVARSRYGAIPVCRDLARRAPRAPDAHFINPSRKSFAHAQEGVAAAAIDLRRVEKSAVARNSQHAVGENGQRRIAVKSGYMGPHSCRHGATPHDTPLPENCRVFDIRPQAADTIRLKTQRIVHRVGPAG